MTEFTLEDIKDDLLRLLEGYGIKPGPVSIQLVILEQRFDELAARLPEAGDRNLLMARGRDDALNWQVTIARQLTQKDINWTNIDTPPGSMTDGGWNG